MDHETKEARRRCKDATRLVMRLPGDQITAAPSPYSVVRGAQHAMPNSHIRTVNVPEDHIVKKGIVVDCTCGYTQAFFGALQIAEIQQYGPAHSARHRWTT